MQEVKVSRAMDKFIANQLIPYLTVKGAAEAIAFYQAAFAAKLDFQLIDPDNGRIGHAELVIGSSRFFLCDEYPEFGAVSADRLGGSPVKFHLEVYDADGFVKQALGHGAVLLRAVKLEFHGHRTGLLADPFGMNWFVSQKVADVASPEMQSRWSASSTKKERA